MDATPLYDKAYWQTLAAAQLPPETHVHARNAAITARYAHWYAQQPTLLKWAGMAAFASHRVGLALLPYEFAPLENAEFAVKKNASGNPVLTHLAASLHKIRETNNQIFNDIGWAHAAYLSPDGGLAAIERCCQADPQAAYLSEGFRLLEQGQQLLATKPQERKAAERLIWRGNTALLRQEQWVIVQPQLAGILQLQQNVAWMNGIQFYLTVDQPITSGHVMCLDSAWALTLISQHQYWRDFDLSQYGDGTVCGILSVDISNWEALGTEVVKKPARDCTLAEIADETWAQLKRSLNKGQEILRDRDRHPTTWYHVDLDIKPDVKHPGQDRNAEPLLINVANTWHLRPGAATQIRNLFLASDYVRTNTQLATMEAANEAARRAVNAILAATDSPAPLCQVWPLYQPWLLAPWRWRDRWRFHRGLPWRGQLPWLLRLGYRLMRFFFRHARSPQPTAAKQVAA